MPTRSEVWFVADRLRAKPQRVSIRSVIDALPSGGSFRVVGQHLAEWKEERCYQPRLELAQLPEALQEQLVGFGKAVWEGALREATRQFQADRDRLEGLRLHDQKLRDEALDVADTISARTDVAAKEAERLRVELAMAKEEIKGLRRKLKGVRAVGAGAEVRKAEAKAAARDYWDRLAKEVRDILSAHRGMRDGMTRDEILRRLPEPLKAEAIELGEDLGLPNLSKRLDERVLRQKYLTKEGRVYRSRDDAAGTAA